MENIIATKSYAFAIRIVGVFRILTEEKKDYVLSRQLLKSGTAIGALVKEAEHAQSKSDFLNKMNIALKEANETEYWLMLLKDTNYISTEQYNSLVKDCKELLKLLISIVKTTKDALKK
ncbi:MAG: four helix bundle protein [Bacteroidota bacterium]|nr:four helix bundle protein [Bacteroidota bacterium]MDP4212729.1 four helix bundle protein [Bacteroidota bacterium]MDP4250527.1 four helix bundle protein [Bacteroidota bacterium]